MEFDCEKYVKLIMKSDKRESTKGIELANQEKIRMFEMKENYKYSEILYMDDVKQAKRKEKK